MAALKLDFCTAAFGAFLSKPARDFSTDLSMATVTGVLEAYEKFKRKNNPKYNLSSERYNIGLVEQQFGITLMPLQINDEFWAHFQMFMIMRGNVGSTIGKYIGEIIAALKWGIRHKMPVSSTFDCYDKRACRYERSKVVLTPDDVSLIAHFDIMAIPYKAEDYYAKAKATLESRWYMTVNKVMRKYNRDRLRLERRYIQKRKEIYDLWHISKERKKKKMCELYEWYNTSLAECRKLLEEIDAEHKEQAVKNVARQMDATARSKHIMRLKTLCRIRDQFVLQCNLAQRYSDICRIEPSCFSSDRNVYSCIQQKTGNKAVVDIKAASFDKNVTHEILKRYDYYSPYPHSLSGFNKGLHELLQIIGGRFNEMIKTENKIRGEVVIEEIPKWKAVASHTARRSFASYNVMRGVKEALIRRWTGHKDSKSFIRYIIFDEDA